ncbi:MAG: ABC transporter permease [Candidatus Bathyarchaeota archaeon]|nr:ABC transporter permease [Candidatus Bathyarchaeota archaeon]
MTLRTYIIRRSIVIIPTFFFISLIIFTLLHLAPGDPLRGVTFGRSKIDPEMLEELRSRWGLDQPIPVQYFIWVGRFLQGDLGYSFHNQRPVSALISERITPTLELMLAAEVLSVAIAVILGVIAAVKHYSISDALASLGALVGYSTPNFWIALMAILVFALQLRWFPTSGTITLGITFSSPFHALLDHLEHLVLPVSILVLGWTAYLFRMVRSSMLEVLGQDYITTARAKGLRERVVIYKHALRNALLPVITYEGISIGYLFGGAATIEYIFAWPGLGQFMVDYANYRDYPTLMGLSMIIAIMVLLANLSADIAYAIADPRIRYE